VKKIISKQFYSAYDQANVYTAAFFAD